jgi:hypothetical protein
MRVVAENCMGNDLPAPSCADRDVYQFGVYTGRSMLGISRFLKQNEVPFRKLWGLDSFEGLPAEQSSETAAVYQKHKASDWKEGAYNSADALHEHTYAALTAKLSTFVNDTRTRWVVR